MHGHRADAHFLARPNDTAGYLAAIGNQDFLKLPGSRVHDWSNVQSLTSNVLLSRTDFGTLDVGFGRLFFNSEQGLPVLNGLSIFDVDLSDHATVIGQDLIH